MAITEQAITATLLKINGTTVPGIKSYKVGYNHLWKDADRNMSGSVRASLIGIFPEIQAIYNALEAQPYFTVQFWDPASDSVKTANYYTADWAVELESKNRGLYKGTTITLVPVDRRA